MDDKADRQMQPKIHGRHFKKINRYRREAWKFLREHKNIVFTCALLVLFVGLLFGLVSQMPVPTANTAPNGVTTVDYNTLVKQVQSGNVQAVAIQGDDVNALLKSPLNGPTTSKDHTIQDKVASNATDYAIWSRMIGMSNPAAGVNFSQMNSQRAIYAHVPQGGKTLLLTMLSASNVQVNILRIAQQSNWLSLFWHFLPIIFLVGALLIFFAARKKRDPMRSMDERFSQMGKSPARRFEGSKEVKSTPPQKTATTPLSKPGSPTKPVAARVYNIC